MLNPNYDNELWGISSLECDDKRLIELDKDARLLQSQMKYEASRSKFYDPLIAKRIALDSPHTSFPLTRYEQDFKPSVVERHGVGGKNLISVMGGIAFAEALIQVLSMQESAQAREDIHSIPLYSVMLGIGAVIGALHTHDRQ